ncbi:MAG: hypothetical protein NUV93_03850 [Firmicutes bacterium]|jgi:Zn finger protein HypA/HybF involved in hydrogenase expression|nr:hypothetical protein [Bacillota bacterium]
MHEISAAHGIIRAVIEECGRRGLARASAFRVSVNALDGLSPENVVHWIEFMGRGTRLEGARVEIRVFRDGEPGCPAPGDMRLDTLEGEMNEPEVT